MPRIDGESVVVNIITGAPRAAGKSVIAACVGFLTLLATLTGCSLLPDAPPAMTTAVTKATDAIRQLDGVISASSDLSLWDAEDGQWRAHITVEARDGDVDLRALVGSVEQQSAVGAVPTSTVVSVPGDDGAADARFFFSASPGMVSREAGEMVDAALGLRAVDGARTVFVADDDEPASVVVASASSLADTVADVRSLSGFGANALSTVGLTAEDGSYNVVFDAHSPTDDLVGFLDDLSRRPGVQSLTFLGVDTWQNPAAWRPTLSVEALSTAEAREITDLLTTLADSAVDGIPRAAFTVAVPHRPTTPAIAGYLGLPLRSPEPDDLPASIRLEPDDLTGSTPSDAAAQTPDPAVVAARLASDTAMISALLDAAGDAAGIRGPASVLTGTCPDGTNQQVQGSVVIPIFEIADSADDAFEAITSAWEKQRFTRSDRAMGRDFYTPADGSLESLSIRGTAEGISIMAAAPCVVSP
jgi:hypothetical protein